ncbi:uncharacterized protein CCR75_001505 [Bremia lactucae]|uniref:Pentacotripeptide-repeat region of PRORP domain-containing protein n=1 Tax=Bremia lactucae TaxID=4779 RepID=A0A976FGG6_BRELC|nr:hypothetical protein CCR75_001505 [Bremia lactucae]
MALHRSFQTARRCPLQSFLRSMHVLIPLQVSAASYSVPSTSTRVVPNNVTDSAVHTLLERAIAQRHPTQALQCLAQLHTSPGAPLLQKLAILLARQKKTSRHDALRAFEILRGVYRLPCLKPDDYTKLASIYVLDACVRHSMLDHAMELYDEALNQAVVLDLPAYDGLLKALVKQKRMEEAMEVLKALVRGEDLCPMETTFVPVLIKLIETREYDEAINVLQQGQKRGVVFTSTTFHPLLTLAEEDTVSTDSLIKFLSFIEDAWEECKDFDVEEYEDDLND